MATDKNPSVSGSKAKNASASKALTTKTPSLASVLKSNAAKSTAKTKASTPKPAAPVQYGRGGAYAAPTGAGAISVGNLINDYFSGVKERIAGGAADTGIIPKPSNAGIVNPINNARSGDAGLGVALQNMAAQQRAAAPSASTAARTGGQAKSIYDYLNVDPTAIYSPLVKLIDEQKKAAQDRYTANLGDIKNIFSALTGIAPADRIRINDQFKNMLTAQQTALAARTAAATEQGNAGAAQAVATGAERGGGDAMVLNPLQTATAEGIAESNKIASIWEGLQGANQAQALADVDTRGAGYTAQQVAATKGLQQSLQDRLMGIAGTEADVQSQLAQQKFDIAQTIGQAKYTNALAAQQAAARAAAAANSPAKMTALEKVRASLEPGQFDAIAAQLNSAYGRAYAGANPATYTGAGKEPSVAAVMAEWATKGNKNLIAQARTIAETIYGR